MADSACFRAVFSLKVNKLRITYSRLLWSFRQSLKKTQCIIKITIHQNFIQNGVAFHFRYRLDSFIKGGGGVMDPVQGVFPSSAEKAREVAIDKLHVFQLVTSTGNQGVPNVSFHSVYEPSEAFYCLYLHVYYTKPAMSRFLFRNCNNFLRPHTNYNKFQNGIILKCIGFYFNQKLSSNGRSEKQSIFSPLTILQQRA